MDKQVWFSQLSPARQHLVRLCQVINYGHLQDLTIEAREPLFDSPVPTALLELRLDSEDPPRDEVAIDDFALCAEVGRLMSLLNQVENGKISKLEVRAGIPRRIVFEKSITNLPVARQAGSKDPVRCVVVDTTAVQSNRGPSSRTCGEGGVRKDA